MEDAIVDSSKLLDFGLSISRVPNGEVEQDIGDIRRGIVTFANISGILIRRPCALNYTELSARSSFADVFDKFVR